jgi:hypothetical protein
MTIPNLLLEIREFLNKNPVSLSSNNSDGRIDSANNEEVIISQIEKNFEIMDSRAREWFDFKFKSGNEWHYVNVKVSKLGSQADNLSCKLGVYLSLTGVEPPFQNEVGWEKYWKSLKQNLNTNNNSDYYFLVINKNDTSDVIVNSLKNLKKLTPNGNNLPFQCVWRDNRDLANRTHDEAAEYILRVFSESVRKSAENFISYQKYFHND